MGGRFHFVCHDCTEEGVFCDRTAAVEVRDEHVDRTDHHVSLRNITRATA